MILLQTLPFFPFQGAPQETPKQISKLPAKTGWRLLQSKSNAVIFTGELPQDIVGSMRVGRREKGEAGKLDSAQHPPSGMLLFLLPDQGRQDAGHWLPAAPCEPLCPRWARHAAVSTTSPDLWERRQPRTGQPCAGALQQWQLYLVVPTICGSLGAWCTTEY